MNILNKLKNEIIVSLQASYNEPLYDENCIIAFAKTLVELGGVKALRLAGERDIKNIKKMYPDIIVIGITKPKIIPKNYKELVYITPNVADCKTIINAGADIVAFDGTMRKRPNGEEISDLINYIKSQNKLAMADIATFDEAENASNSGCDIISTTLSGYTIETQNKPNTPDFELIKQIKTLNKFGILEGKIWEQKDVKKAFEMGANSVVIGSAITRPQLIYKRFKEGK
ncbi:MAG: putative N-acetylmannosamine-6-phosphate 2-epimerase [Candidatus Gastranaerophilales bacterium]|nr:putative N-acetylmannosamine-6-phosphate 2-epimerase [Candidatus Gastranaerophilales bacterium]